MVRRKRNNLPLRGAVMIDGDNICATFERYGYYPSLDDILPWLCREEAPFGIDRIAFWCYYRTYQSPRMPQEGERAFRQSQLHNYHFCDHRFQAIVGVAAYTPNDVFAHALDTIGQWDTIIFVSSNVRNFERFAGQIRSPEYVGKEAVIVASHLDAYAGWLDGVNNGYPLERIFPKLMTRYVEKRGFHPEKIFQST